MDNKEKILKWCGWTIGGSPDFINSKDIATHYYVNPDGNADNPPELSMNFFFKWVVPKLHEKGYEVTLFAESPSYGGVEFEKGHSYATQHVIDKFYEAHNPNIAQAWQEALLKLIDSGEK